ncbi:MAG TPA: lysyl oxidase family protein [Anaerolineales bacterium]|nr:lysyl oxidase family protein [Anaerolineales bacterium]
MKDRSLCLWSCLLGFAALLNIATLPRPIPENAHPFLAQSEWIPLEDETFIQRLQYPEKFPPALHLPDLRSLPPTDLLLQILRGQGITRLRFTNTIWNSGPGALEMRAAPFPLPGAVQVFQVILRTDGTSIFQNAGLFDYHDVHGHWHWDGFSIYQVWSLTPGGALDQLVASSDKVGYCLIDMEPYPDTDAPPFPEGITPPAERQYTGCIWTYQGISAGWIDSYKSQIGGQYVDITGLPNGVYALQSIVDPDNIIREGDDTNNAVVVYFRLEGERLIVLGERYELPEPGQMPR